VYKICMNFDVAIAKAEFLFKLVFFYLQRKTIKTAHM